MNLWKDIKKSDIVHIQYMFNTSTLIALFYAKVLSKKVILSPRGALCKWCLAQGSRFKQKWLQLLIAPLAHNVVWHATAEQEKDDILIQFPTANVVIITNGIEYEKFQQYHKLSTEDFCNKFIQKKFKTDKIIISIGRLFKVKGFDILIDSFNEVLKLYPDAKLFIAGPDEGEKNNLLRQIIDLKLMEKIFLIGSIDGHDKVDFLANADLFVLPSHTENFGNVYLESLAAGTPIVASTGTPWKVVEEADCGKWVNNSVEETSQAMLEMLERDRAKMRVNSKRLAKKYDWKTIALQFKRIIL